MIFRLADHRHAASSQPSSKRGSRRPRVLDRRRGEVGRELLEPNIFGQKGPSALGAAADSEERRIQSGCDAAADESPDPRAAASRSAISTKISRPALLAQRATWHALQVSGSSTTAPEEG